MLNVLNSQTGLYTRKNFSHSASWRKITCIETESELPSSHITAQEVLSFKEVWRLVGHVSLLSSDIETIQKARVLQYFKYTHTNAPGKGLSVKV
jgi:hypothetical protein